MNLSNLNARLQKMTNSTHVSETSYDLTLVVFKHRQRELTSDFKVLNKLKPLLETINNNILETKTLQEKINRIQVGFEQAEQYLDLLLKNTRKMARRLK